MIGRTLLVLAIGGMLLHHAAAQFGGAPGTLPDGSSAGSTDPGAGGAPAGPPPKCQALLAQRDEVQKHGQAIEAANRKKADVRVACGLFRRYIAAEAKMLKMLEADGALCGAPPQTIQQVRDSQGKATQIAKQVCDAAARQSFRYDAPAPAVDDDELRQFRLHPEPRPKP
jgi:hypothetical protein